MEVRASVLAHSWRPDGLGQRVPHLSEEYNVVLMHRPDDEKTVADRIIGLSISSNRPSCGQMQKVEDRRDIILLSSTDKFAGEKPTSYWSEVMYGLFAHSW